MRNELKRYGRMLLSLLLGLVLALTVLSLVSCGEDVTGDTQSLRTKRHIFQSAVITTGNGVVLHTSGYPYLSIDVAGIVTATVSFEQTVNGTDWRAFQVVNTSDGSTSTTATADGTWVVGNIGVYDYVRVRVSSWTSGTITVMGQAMESVGESGGDVTLAANDGVDIGDVTLNNTDDITVTLDGEAVDVTTSVDFTVTLDSEVVSVLPEDADGDQIEIGPNGSVATKQLVLDIDECETVTSPTVVGSTDVSGISTDTAHRGTGTNSIKFDKAATTQAFAQISRVLTTGIDASDWSRHAFVDYWLWIEDADLAGITAVYLGLGTDANNYWYWQTLAADLNEGVWNHIHHALGDIDVTLAEAGVGADWSDITYWKLFVVLSGTGTTLTDMRIDGISLERTDSVYVRDVYNDGYSQTVNINDASAGSQTNDITVEGVAGEAHLGEVGYSGDWITATMTMAASTYADGDVLADTQELAGAIRINGGNGFITSIVILDEDDQGGDLDVVFFRSDVSLGTEDSAVSISDADARQIMCTVRVLSSDYDDLIASQVAVLSNVGCGVESASDSTSIWMGLISRDTKTYTNGGIQVAVFFDQN